MKKYKKNIIIIFIILFLLANIIFFGFIDIIKISAKKTIEDGITVKYKISIFNHEITKIEKICIYETKEIAKSNYESYQEINKYLEDSHKIDVLLKNKKLVFNIDQSEFLSDIYIDYYDSEEQLIQILNENGFTTKIYLNYKRIGELFSNEENE